MGDVIKFWRERLERDVAQAGLGATALEVALRHQDIVNVLKLLDELFQLECRLAAAILRVIDRSAEDPIDPGELRLVVNVVDQAVALLEKHI